MKTKIISLILLSILISSCSPNTNTEELCTYEYMPVCGQPPMPECPEGLACAQVMPEPKTYSNECEMRLDNATLIKEGEC